MSDKLISANKLMEYISRITLKKKDSKLWYWEVFHIPTTRKNKERWQDRISKIRNEPIKSGTDLNDITEWGEYEVNDGNDNNET